MISIFLAEELEQIANQDITFLQYYCDNKDEKRNTAITILRGLIFQLLQACPKLLKHILPIFKIQKNSLFTGSSLPTLWTIFENMVCDPILDTTYCVLDGPDECDETSLRMLLEKFVTLLSAQTYESSACYLNLIVVSRDLPDFIPELLSSFPRIRLDPDADTEVNQDIHRFIESKVNELSAKRKYPESLRVHVKEVFQNRAQGTFLWVGIAAKMLEKYRVTDVERALDLFPPGLDELYARILLQIDTAQRETAAKILRWVVMAARPLTLSELSDVIEIPAGPSVAFSREERMKDQVSYCGHFLTIKGDEVGLIHQSAKDYLLRKTPDTNPQLEVFRFSEEVVNLEITRKCLNYLQNSALGDGSFNPYLIYSYLKTFPLLLYAILYWPEHARSLSRSKDVFNPSLPFFNKKSDARECWLKAYWNMKELDDPPKSFTLLHLASYFGILGLAENLLFTNDLFSKLKRRLFIGKADSEKMTALHYAARDRHKAVVLLLLEHGADMEAKDYLRKTVLCYGATDGQEAVVRLLREKAVDIKAKNIDKRTALHQAAISGRAAVVQLLLEKGADVEAKDKDRRTALHWTAGRRHEAVVRLLLKKRADIEAKNKDRRIALY